MTAPEPGWCHRPSSAEASRVLVIARPQRGGLGNRLFPWARAVIHAELASLPMAPTRWWQLKVGPTLRRERDNRLYRNLLDPEPWASTTSLRDRLAISPLLPEPAMLGCSRMPFPNGGRIVFRGLADYFDRLVPHRSLVREKLRLVSRCRSDRQLDHPQVVAHVRRSDFPRHLRTPDRWFLGAADMIRSIGYDGPIGLVTDGEHDDVAALVSRGFAPVLGGNALDDLWTLASARVLLGSGSSTFSSWGAFLGRGLAIVPDHLDFTGLEWQLPADVLRLGGGSLPDDRAAMVKAVLDGS